MFDNAVDIIKFMHPTYHFVFLFSFKAKRPDGGLSAAQMNKVYWVEEKQPPDTFTVEPDDGLQSWAIRMYSWKGASTVEPNFSPQWSLTLLDVTRSRNGRIASAMICWLLLALDYVTDRNLQKSQLVDSWLECPRNQSQWKKQKGTKILCKNQDNCERERKVVGRGSK